MWLLWSVLGCVVVVAAWFYVIGKMFPDDFKITPLYSAPAALVPSMASKIEDALWALNNYESNRDDGRAYSEVEISDMVAALRAMNTKGE